MSKAPSTEKLARSPETDEVVALGARLGAAMKREEELEAKSKDARAKKDGSAEVYSNSAAIHSSDEAYTIRDMIAMTKARTLSGAAIQIVEAMNRASSIWDEFPEEKDTYQIRRDVRALERLLFSALDLIEEKTGRKVEELVHDHFGIRHQDPWIPVEDRLKAIGADSAQATKGRKEEGGAS